VVLADETTWRFQQVIDRCRDAFVEIDRDCLVVAWNSRSEELFGWSRDEMIGRSVFDVVDGRSTDVVEQGIAVLRSAAIRCSDAVLRKSMPAVVVHVRHRDGSIVPISGVFFALGAGEEFSLAGFMRLADDEDMPHTGDSARDRLHDPLTGLPNRTLFMRRLGVAIEDLARTGGSVAVAVFDLDRFNAINDAMGHDTGDDVLVAVVSRLRLAGGALRPLLSRLGGDEFLALFEHRGSRAVELAEEFADLALEALGDPFDIGGREIFLTASVGIAATGDPACEASRLLSNGDAAMHESKAEGGKGRRVFGDAMRQQVIERMTTEHSLHRALDRRELTLFYQPVVDISRQSTTGVEALIRWQHPEHGLVPPDRFIPVAEESGLIIPIGAWVLEEACRQLRLWRQQGDSAPSGTMEVNLSARQIDDPEIVSTVEAILRSTGLPADALTLEITESALMRDAVSALYVLRALKRIGVALAIDDFGTGYSSLSYLQRFPLDILKIDKSFVSELDKDQGTEIVAAVVNLAHALGLHVVAEGVETEQQLSVLRQLGCDYAQGYLFSRPMPATELVDAFSLSA